MVVVAADADLEADADLDAREVPVVVAACSLSRARGRLPEDTQRNGLSPLVWAFFYLAWAPGFPSFLSHAGNYIVSEPLRLSNQLIVARRLQLADGLRSLRGYNRTRIE